MNNAITGIFFSFTPEELDLLYSRAKRRGYTEDIEGVKKWILDIASRGDDNATDRVCLKIGEYVTANPETIVKYLNVVNNVVKSVIKKAG